jgi:hypothetical protein
MRQNCFAAQDEDRLHVLILNARAEKKIARPKKDGLYKTGIVEASLSRRFSDRDGDLFLVPRNESSAPSLRVYNLSVNHYQTAILPRIAQLSTAKAE